MKGVILVVQTVGIAANGSETSHSIQQDSSLKFDGSLLAGRTQC